jgi:predicted  nucleic acid-binding Zn-ribbon protein
MNSMNDSLLSKIDKHVKDFNQSKKEYESKLKKQQNELETLKREGNEAVAKLWETNRLM